MNDDSRVAFEIQVLDLLAKIVEAQNAQADSLNLVHKKFSRLREPFAELDRSLATLEDITRQAVEDGRQARVNTHYIRNVLQAVVECTNELVRIVRKLAQTAKGPAPSSNDRLQALVEQVNKAVDQ